LPLALVFVMGACSSETPDAGASIAISFFQEWRDKAQSGGASPSQLAVLDAAVASGTLDYGDIEPLRNETYGCFEANGLSYQVLESDGTIPEFPYPRYGVGVDPRQAGLTEEQGQAIAQDCTTKYLDFALDAYGSQPAAQSALDAQLIADLPMITACLQEHGVTVAPDATPDDVRRAVADLYFEQSTESQEGPLCYDRLG